jgi:phosphatidylglycerol---prolipoprotein diacylglyceryl transferase
MIVININPVIFTVGPVSLHWYGLMYVVGMVAGLLVTWPYDRSLGITMEQVGTVVFWAIPAGLIGARLYYVIQQPLEQYIENPFRIFAVWEGGMAFYGAVFAVVLTIILVTRHMHVSTWKFLDVSVIFGVVGQFFGRIGNLINGDVIGYPTDLPWGIVYAHPDSLAPRHDVAYHPAAIYEGIANIIIFGILWSLRKKLKPGMLFFIYIFTYSLSQIIIFNWRDNDIVLFGIKQAQLTAIAVIIVAAVVFVWFLRRQHTTQTQTS